jgi:hypothetical protein
MPHRTTRILGCTLAALTGCQDYLFYNPIKTEIVEAQINVNAEPEPADILFVVDNSGSMADEQELLARNFDAFITEIAGAGDANYQIAVVTTDVDTPGGERAGLQISTFAAEYPNPLTGIDAGMCTSIGIEHGCFRGPNPETRIISSSRLTKEQQVAAFAENVRVGSCGSGSEKGLAAMQRALDQANGCNQGFLRDDANLVVVFVSDENDSTEASLDEVLATVTRHKSIERVRVASIVGSVDGAATSCRIPNNAACGSLCSMPGAIPGGENADQCDWCSFFNTSDCCSARSGDRYVDFARLVESRVSAAIGEIPISGCRAPEDTQAACLVDSICQESFSATLERIATELIIRTRFTLDPPALNPEGVVVKITEGRFGKEGITLKYGADFVVSADGKTLTISGENTPRRGEQVHIYFVVEKRL